MNLGELQKKYNIRRIDFSKVNPVENEEQYGVDKLICPYCGEEMMYDAEYIDNIIHGTPWRCCSCDRNFFVEGEISIETTCTPIENKVLESFTRNHIKSSYEHMDKCAERGCEWDSAYGTVELSVYSQCAEPLLENMKVQSQEKEENRE